MSDERELTEAQEAAWAKLDIPPDIPGSPWEVGAALRETFDAGYLAAITRAESAERERDELAQREREPSEEKIERVAKAMQSVGRDRWRGNEWMDGKGWRNLDWDEIPPSEKAVPLALARVALEVMS